MLDVLTFWLNSDEKCFATVALVEPVLIPVRFSLYFFFFSATYFKVIKEYFVGAILKKLI